MSPRNGLITEAEHQQALVRILRTYGWAVQWTWSSKHSPAGWPDLTAAKGLDLLVWELKREDTKPTAEQVWWLNWWRVYADAVNFYAAHMLLPIEGMPEPISPRIHVALVRPSHLEAAAMIALHGVAAQGGRLPMWKQQEVPIARPRRPARRTA